MSENENDSKSLTDEAITDDDKITTGRTLPIKRKRFRKLDQLRQPRQKFSLQWEIDFPWLRADKVDESVGFCTVCNKRLVCKKSHLERHEKSFKHARLQGIESLDTDYKAEYLECENRREEEEDIYEESIEFSSDWDVSRTSNSKQENNSNNSKIMKKKTISRNYPQDKHMPDSPKPSLHKMNRFKLLKSIDRDRDVFTQMFPEKRVAQDHQQTSLVTASPPSQPPRDHFDLFFESVSASVKTFSPKMAAEIKSAISQLLADYELRAICEREEQQNNHQVVGTTQEIVKTELVQNEINKALASVEPVHAIATTVPHILYSFQTK